jgi:aspartate/methionine/tyrosine aminotransferase
MRISRRGTLAPRAHVDDLEAAYGQRKDVCQMCAGSVGYGPAPAALQAVSRLEEHLGGGYGPVAGESALLANLREKLFLHNGIDVDAQRAAVLVTAGANQAFVNVLLAVADSGDAVILFAPYYFSHYSAALFAGLRPIVLNSNSHESVAGALQYYSENLLHSEVPSAETVRAVVVCTPCNPTGSVLDNAELWKIAHICEAHDWWLIIDEAYEHFDFEMQLLERDGELTLTSIVSPSCLTGLPQRIRRPYLMHNRSIHIFSMSKSFGMAGYRVGYILCPQTAPIQDGADLFDALVRVNDTIVTHASRQSQLLALCVLRDPACISTLQSRRLRVLLYVRELYQFAFKMVRAGLIELTPSMMEVLRTCQRNGRPFRIGAFYLFCRALPKRNGSTRVARASDLELCHFLADSYRVLVAPGSIFGTDARECWIRVSVGACCCNDIHGLRDALRRLAAGIAAFQEQKLARKVSSVDNDNLVVSTTF